MRKVILCDTDGNETGISDVLPAHQGEGSLHKAFSVFIFGNGGRSILLQKRSRTKMLWPLHWSNTCCSHPQPESTVKEDAEKRLQEECGFTTELTELGSFVYRAEDPEKRGSEYEFDTILVGFADEDTEMDPNPEEIEEMKWIDLEDLVKDMAENPKDYTPWFFIALKYIIDKGQKS